jgi:hypothetical protein
MRSICGADDAVHNPTSAVALQTTSYHCWLTPLALRLFCYSCCQDFNRTLLFDIKLLSVRKAPR